ncbi:MAG: FAD-dependent oxidoreductase [Fimbriimonadaceae bacterium]|nr:FAD-dependent oxidoreductase [Fimbriimonadaceae bacterium]
MRTIEHEADLCVVGGGMTGLCAAVAAARHGATVVLVQDRPVLGGNASSEVRMWICGAHGKDNRETGILEEIELDNIRRNPSASWALWDALLYEKAKYQPGLTLLLNCSVNQGRLEGDALAEITAWQGTAETWHVIRAKLFADTSGDSILAPLTGAEVRIGREAASEFDEDIQPAEADRKTMGMSCLITPRETDRPQPFVAPAWANVYATAADLPHRHCAILKTNFWWIELGGEHDSIHDTEHLRDELLKVSYGVWDHLKNRGDYDAANWMLDWVGMVPGKRESRRYVGDHLLTQNDVRAEGRFDDVVAFGGWSMDDHHPAGIRYPGKPTVFHPAPSPYGIPYRCLYSRSVRNLFCGGRNISTTHAALSSTRVMATCAVIGQAVGTAAALAARHGLSPREVGQQRIAELQDLLQDDDCFIPWRQRPVSGLSRNARLTASSGDPEPLRDGWDRPDEGGDHAWSGAPGDCVEYRFDQATALSRLRLIADSQLNRKGKNMPTAYPLNPADHAMPGACSLHHPMLPGLLRQFRVEAEIDGQWVPVAAANDNHQRLVRIPLEVTASAVRLVIEASWGAPTVKLFAFEVE